MKQIIFFSSLFVFSLLVSCAETKEETKEGTKEEAKEGTKESIASIKIQEIGLEVMTKNLGAMNWEEAKKACENLGDGWRLPTKEELGLMYINKDKIGGFANSTYWSSTEFDANDAWLFGFFVEDAYGSSKDSTSDVRAVRSF